MIAEDALDGHRVAGREGAHDGPVTALVARYDASGLSVLSGGADGSVWSWQPRRDRGARVLLLDGPVRALDITGGRVVRLLGPRGQRLPGRPARCGRRDQRRVTRRPQDRRWDGTRCCGGIQAVTSKRVRPCGRTARRRGCPPGRWRRSRRWPPSARRGCPPTSLARPERPPRRCPGRPTTRTRSHLQREGHPMGRTPDESRVIVLTAPATLAP